MSDDTNIKYSIPTALKEAKKSYLENENPFGVPRAERYQWTTGLNLPRDHETIFFGSCMNPLMGYGEVLLKSEKTLSRLGLDVNKVISLGKVAQKLKMDKLMGSVAELNREYGQTLVHAVEILKELHYDFGLLYEEEPCCGGGLHTYGFLDEFKQRAKKVYQFFKSRGIKRIITTNPICGGILKYHYPRYIDGFDIEVKHITEVIADYLENHDLKLRASSERKVVFHDPCYLSRFMGVVEEPRKILKRIDGLTFVEPVNNKLATKCDGGGGIEVVYPKLARTIAANRYKELIDTGADLIVTACAPCIMMIRIGQNVLGRNEKIMDIVDVFYEALKGTL